jgi:hypothetical protein
MDVSHPTTSNVSSKQHLWPRDRISNLVEQIRLDRCNGASLKQTAADNGVPRSTAQNWQCNRVRLEQQSGLEPTVVQFFRVTPRARAPT